jgi:hypothetical protein
MSPGKLENSWNFGKYFPGLENSWNFQDFLKVLENSWNFDQSALQQPSTFKKFLRGTMPPDPPT